MSQLISGGIRAFALGFALLIGLHVLPGPAAAHPADELLQDMTVRLEPERAEVSIAIGGGLLANEMVVGQLDADGDGEITEGEALAWAERFLADVEVHLNGEPVALVADDLTVTAPPAWDLLIGLSPLLVAFDVPLPGPEGEAPVAHDLIVQNVYLLELTDFQVRTEVGAGASVTLEPQPSRMARIGFEVDPGQAGGRESGADAATSWGDGGVVARAKELLEGPKTPLLMSVFLGVFLAMGALHALQPGHGKALVAAYLVATRGTPRDAVALAGIVTFTHTIVVSILALATLGASQIFLPSRVIPALTVLSGVLVAGMGVVMLRNALRNARRRAARGHDHHHHHHHGHDHSHHHHHDHSTLTDEEHARLHLEEVQRIRPVGADGRRLSVRNLVAMGVFGGIAPCPDALAILLLAVGINQFALGMLALVAFSVGLAGVLVGFGLVIALAGPVWTRFGRRGRHGISGGLSRVVGVSPVVSAAFVLLLGLAMVWSAGGLATLGSQ